MGPINGMENALVLKSMDLNYADLYGFLYVSLCEIYLLKEINQDWYIPIVFTLASTKYNLNYMNFCVFQVGPSFVKLGMDLKCGVRYKFEK